MTLSARRLDHRHHKLLRLLPNYVNKQHDLAAKLTYLPPQHPELTHYFKSCRGTDSSVDDIFCHTTVVGNILPPHLDNDQVAISCSKVVGIPFYCKLNFVFHPVDLKELQFWEELEKKDIYPWFRISSWRMTPHLHLASQLDTLAVRGNLKLFVQI